MDQFEEFTARDDLFGVEKNAAEEIVEDQWTAQSLLNLGDDDRVSTRGEIRKREVTLSKNAASSTDESFRLCTVDTSVAWELFIVGDMDWTLLVIVRRFFLVAVGVVVLVAGDFDAEIDRLLEMIFVLVDELVEPVVFVRLGDGGRVCSSLIVAEVSTVNVGADERRANEDNGEELQLLLLLLLLIVKNEDEVVVMDDETGLLMMRRGVGLETMEVLPVVGLAEIELVGVG